MTSGIGLLLALSAAIQMEAPAPVSESPEATVHLEVQASPSCASRGDIIARVASRSARIHFVDGNAATSVNASFAADRSGGVTGELIISGPGRNALSRRVIATSCSEATDAIALIIVVTLDPTSLAGGRDTKPEPMSPEPPAGSSDNGSPTSGSSPGPAPAANARTPEPKPVATKPPATPAVAAPVVSLPPAAPATTRRASVGLAALAIVGPAPAVMPGIGITTTAALDRDALWSPALRIGAMHAWSSGFVAGGGTASFRLDAVSLDACAIHVGLPLLEGRGCASALVGRLSTGGSDTSNPASFARPFAVVGAAVPLTIRLGSIFELSPRLGVGVTLVRDWYLFGPTTFHRADPLTIDASVGLGLRLP